MQGHIHRALGLTDDEADSIESLLGRPPNHLELAMYAVMWSEHCSYKSSRVHLKRLPTEGERVLVGPGENAGVVDAGDGLAVALRIESHNHPSAIEPYQGAATGVGGILRDIFTMGARPIALMDPLRFGDPADPRSRWIATGVISGISGYGNSVGVPTVGGEIVFDECYGDNPLVNVLCCGVLPKDRLVLGRASGEGNLAVLLGSTTGRDGIGGVSVLASAGFSDDADTEAAKRPNVQVGDPYEEKRLIEACLQLLDESLVVGIQDLGGAGLTCATSETASRGGVGMDVNVAAVPRREPGMEPWEVMTSESQERMLAIVTPGSLPRAMEVCERWEVRAAVVGRVTGGGRLRILDGWDGPVLADVPASTLHEDAPVYERPIRVPADLAVRRADGASRLPDPAPREAADHVLGMLSDPAWVYRQYDHQLFLNTVVAPGGDAALLRLAGPGVPPGPCPKAIALSTDGNSRWCALDPRLGTALVVAESALNVACVGAVPIALVNCLNFGNPEHPETMWQLSEAIDGMAEACRALAIPVIGGNVSLYNESRGRDIDPTPVVATLGLVDHLRGRPPGAQLVAGNTIVVVGPPDGDTSLSGSKWAKEIHGHTGGTLPAIDYPAHQRLLTLVADLVGEGAVEGVHDVSDGGLALALAEMAVSGGAGFTVDAPVGYSIFAEGPSRVLLSVVSDRVPALVARAQQVELRAEVLGQAGGRDMVIAGRLELGLEDATRAWRGALPRALALTGQ
ncbi:MAG: phosphoribosylformylglycinamidine synthase subunit PurL [Acidimicrobiales bacterium]|nr:phosphoribosylformylglycinamidine synthase subunit PurL [Acidimicrobiales bacterium]